MCNETAKLSGKTIKRKFQFNGGKKFDKIEEKKTRKNRSNKEKE
jgi:hypothetical protein